MAGGKLATENTVVRAPNGYEFIIAAGDPIPEGVEFLRYVGYVENEPNTVSVADNEPDAADRVADHGGPGPHVVERFGSTAAPDALLSGHADPETGEVAPGYVETGSNGDAAGGENGASARPGKKAKRAELDAYATTVGLDPSAYSSKDELNDALDQLEDGGYD